MPTEVEDSPEEAAAWINEALATANATLPAAESDKAPLETPELAATVRDLLGFRSHPPTAPPRPGTVAHALLDPREGEMNLRITLPMTPPTEHKIRWVGPLKCANCKAKLQLREHGGGRPQRWCSDKCRMAYARRKKWTLINSCRPKVERGLDAYFTPPEAVKALMHIERLPLSIADPCCGNGAILDVLKEAGHVVFGTDIVNYGWPHTVIRDYLAAPIIMGDVAIVSNPPYRLAEKFVRKADGCQYHAWLLRLNFLESIRRVS